MEIGRIKDVAVIGTIVLLAALAAYTVWSLHSGMGEDDDAPFKDVIPTSQTNPFVVPLQPYKPPTGAPTAVLPNGA